MQRQQHIYTVSHKTKPTHWLQVPNSILDDNTEMWRKHACLIDSQIVFAVCHVYKHSNIY